MNDMNVENKRCFTAALAARLTVMRAGKTWPISAIELAELAVSAYSNDTPSPPPPCGILAEEDDHVAIKTFDEAYRLESIGVRVSAISRIIAAHRQAAAERECARLREELAQAHRHQPSLIAGELHDKITQARSEIAALRLDAERLDWLCTYEGAEWAHSLTDCWQDVTRAGIDAARQAIDQARSSGAGS